MTWWLDRLNSRWSAQLRRGLSRLCRGTLGCHARPWRKSPRPPQSDPCPRAGHAKYMSLGVGTRTRTDSVPLRVARVGDPAKASLQTKTQCLYFYPVATQPKTVVIATFQLTRVRQESWGRRGIQARLAISIFIGCQNSFLGVCTLQI